MDLKSLLNPHITHQITKIKSTRFKSINRYPASTQLLEKKILALAATMMMTNFSLSGVLAGPSRSDGACES